MSRVTQLSIVFFLILLCKVTVKAQIHSYKPLTISIFTIGTQLPGGKILPIHPGIELGTEFKYNNSEKNKWLQTVKLGFYHHRYSQTAIQLYSEIDYRPTVWKKLSGDIKLGVGYLYAIPDLQIFESDDGPYKEKSNYGRHQITASMALGLGYSLTAKPESSRIFITMQSFIQAPFIKTYVPVLPNTAWHLGISLPIFKKK